ncbi:MAG: phosphatidylglycerophosphatase A [Bacteroidota bacterium]
MEQEQNPEIIEQEKPSVDGLTKFVASGIYTGYAPAASGTFGSLAACAFFFIPNFTSVYVIIPATILLFIIGGRVADKMEKVYGQDPSQVTIDEFVGMWISVWFIPFSFLNFGLAFVIFRILDILKPYPAAEFDKRSGGWNIMLDDVIAGIYTNVIIQLALRINLFF